VERDEVVGRDERSDRKIPPQAPHRRQAEDAVTTGVGEGAHVRPMVDEGRRDELVETVTLDHDVASGVEQRGGTVRRV
jgi:hypothetical protein